MWEVVGCYQKKARHQALLSLPQGGNRDDLVLVMSSLLSTAVKAVRGESFRSWPLSCSMNRSVFLHRPVSLGRASYPQFFMRRWSGRRPRPQHVVLYEPVLTVNFNSMLRFNVIKGTLMQTTRDQACLVFDAVFCCDIVNVPRDGSCCERQVTSGVMVDVDGNAQRLWEWKALKMSVSVCLLFKLYASLPNVTCYSNCICVWKCICKEKHKDITRWP